MVGACRSLILLLLDLYSFTMSFIKGRSLIVSMGRVLISESSRFNLLQGTLLPKVYLHSSYIYNQDNEAIDIKSYNPSGKVQKNFGEIVELGDDFDMVEQKEGKWKRNGRRTVKREAKAVRKTLRESADNSESSDPQLKKSKTPIKTMTYEATERNESILSLTMTQLKSNKKIIERKEIALEGKRLISDALAAGLTPKKVFFTRAAHLEGLGLPEQVQCFRISYKASQLWSATETSQGIIGVFDLTVLEKLKPRTDCMPLTIICDNIRDPGNMGSVLRVAAGAGCEKLLLTKGCVDIWGQKVLRAGAGAHFHLPILKSLTWSAIETEICEESDIFLADCNYCSKTESDSTESSKGHSKFTNESNENLPLTSCFSVEFKNKSTVIVIGGETHGISNEAYEFAQKKNGTRIFIPIENKVESLNTGVALGILTYEFKRQLYCLSQESHSAISQVS